MATLPYVTATGNVERALNAIRSAATPERVSQDFVKTILKIPGGSGNQMLSFLKKIGFVAADGAPSEIYKQFRNTATTGAAAAKALKIGYAPLYKRNEYMHSLPDEALRGLILEETGQASDSQVATMIVNSMKPLKKLAKHSDVAEEVTKAPESIQAGSATHASRPSDSTESAGSAREKSAHLGLNLAYTINLNLPATSDVAVFNAIFKSLKENLLRIDDE